MIHIGDTKTPLEDLTAMLRPGDVVTHCFTGHPHGVVDDDGRVNEGVREAQQRGVIFDVGHGAGSFSFDVAEKAISQGFLPGNISSDLHIYNIEGPVFDQVTTLSKFMHLGISLCNVIRLSSETAARTMGLEGSIGTLNVGAEGDATIHPQIGRGQLHPDRLPERVGPGVPEAQPRRYDKGRQNVPALA